MELKHNIGYLLGTRFAKSMRKKMFVNGHKNQFNSALPTNPSQSQNAGINSKLSTPVAITGSSMPKSNAGAVVELVLRKACGVNKKSENSRIGTPDSACQFSLSITPPTKAEVRHQDNAPIDERELAEKFAQITSQPKSATKPYRKSRSEQQMHFSSESLAKLNKVLPRTQSEPTLSFEPTQVTSADNPISLLSLQISATALNSQVPKPKLSNQLLKQRSQSHTGGLSTLFRQGMLRDAS